MSAQPPEAISVGDEVEIVVEGSDSKGTKGTFGIVYEEHLEKGYLVRFDNGKEHRYKKGSVKKAQRGRKASVEIVLGEEPAAQPPAETKKESDNKEGKMERSGSFIDEYGLPRHADGRRKVELIHAPWYLELASHVAPYLSFAMFWYVDSPPHPDTGAVRSWAVRNLKWHALIFGATVHYPALITDKFSWIDLSWPLGLASMGIQTWMYGTSEPKRRGIFGAIYFFIGARMSWWFLANFNIVKKGRELPRYQYRRKIWEDSPWFWGLVKNTQLSMQLEICEQWVWNVSWLHAPALLHCFDKAPSLGPLEMTGLGLWALCFLGESWGDASKFEFVIKCKKQGQEARLGRTGGAVCNIGPWRYTRHPNYFFQWLSWVGMCITCIPPLMRLRGEVDEVKWWSFAALLGYVPVGSYLMMVYYTGCIPAEVYTVQTRPAYKLYQKTTNMFFPWKPKAGIDSINNPVEDAPKID